MRSIKNCLKETERLKAALKSADAVVIGAGAGLSTSAGFVYTGERFQKYFQDFADRYGFQDMYSGGFYPYETLEEHWAYWSRYIYINRYMDAPVPVYDRLYELVRDKDYHVITTNVDHCFEKAGFERERLFYTQGYVFSENGEPYIPEGTERKMKVSSELVPRSPVCGSQALPGFFGSAQKRADTVSGAWGRL